MMPIIPHFASECISVNNFNTILNWPSYDEKMLIEENVNIVLQINGKKRNLINVNRDINEEDLLNIIKNDKNIQKQFDIEKQKRIIYIKNKIINIII